MRGRWVTSDTAASIVVASCSTSHLMLLLLLGGIGVACLGGLVLILRLELLGLRLGAHELALLLHHVHRLHLELELLLVLVLVGLKTKEDGWI